jgi:hypothetical protein
MDWDKKSGSVSAACCEGVREERRKRMKDGPFDSLAFPDLDESA